MIIAESSKDVNPGNLVAWSLAQCFITILDAKNLIWSKFILPKLF